MNDCIFCKIAAGEIPSDKVFENENVIAFRDIYPQAPVHILVIPKEHIASVADLDQSNSHIVAKCFEAITDIVKTEGLDKGFRVVTNSGPDGNQSVFHLHFHLLGGKSLGPALAC